MRLKFALLPLALLSGPVWAQMSPALDRFNLAIGGFRGDTSTDLSAHTRGPLPGGLAPQQGKVSLEDDLGLPSHQGIFRVQAEGVVGEHHGWAVDYYNLSRDHTRTFGTTVPVNGTDVGVQARVKGTMDLTLGSASYRYWIGSGSDVLGLGVGAAYYHVNLKVRGDLAAPSAGLATDGTAGYREGAWAPELSLGYRHAFNERWRLYANAAGIKKNGGNLAGHIYSGALGVEYFPWKNLGFGLDYSVSKVQLRRERPNYAAQLDLKTHGPGAYVHWRF
jgi:hypothetical protein